MAAHIGIVACSAEGAALCYRTICTEARHRMGEHAHPEVTMHTPSFASYMEHIRAGRWNEVANLMLASTRIVAAAGAQFAICPDNTIHQAFDLVAAESPIPWLHIADAVMDEAGRQGLRRLAILGTKYLMTGPVYAQAASRRGIAHEIPESADRERVDTIIFTELVNGLLLEPSRAWLCSVIASLRQRGCDGVVLGCTELPLIIEPQRSPLPTLDSTRLLARAALARSLS